MGWRLKRNTTHPKKSAWSDVPYREGERISSGYSVSLVLSVPSPIAAITKRTGRMTWAMKPRTSRRVWWNLLMNKADVFLSSNGKPCRLLDLIRSWSGYKRTHFATDQYSWHAENWCSLELGVTLAACSPFQMEKSKLVSWTVPHLDRSQVLDQVTTHNTSFLLDFKCTHVACTFWHLARQKETSRYKKLSAPSLLSYNFCICKLKILIIQKGRPKANQ